MASKISSPMENTYPPPKMNPHLNLPMESAPTETISEHNVFTPSGGKKTKAKMVSPLKAPLKSKKGS